MPCIAYKKIKFQKSSLSLINEINVITAGYQKQGYSLTLRQTYYQLVSKNIIENTNKSYKNIGILVKNGRYAGLIDWNAIEDRNRNLNELTHWNSPSEIIKSAAYSYRRDLWEDQDCYCEVWVEKDALSGLVKQAAGSLGCPSFACRGYTSASELWRAAARFMNKTRNAALNGKTRHNVIIHLGDHDPSGQDMTRDIENRLQEFGAIVDIQRIALNKDQIDKYKLPSQPLKKNTDNQFTDTRAESYIKKYGKKQSWELDALEPEILNELITSNIKIYLDQDKFTKAKNKTDAERQQITALMDYLPGF